ncbi:hypothetical protein GCM10022244_57930 [Streptomyces gulbargensis]|uniref:UmuC domain-containing protein n=1 Tax=Streptomyces gulbargensis TaxID=364901 RepID=A0ABP7NBY5_9ACTN
MAAGRPRRTRLPPPHGIEELHGVGARTAQELRRYGLHTIGGLAAQPESLVCRLVGQQGRVLLQRARAIDPRAVVARRLPETSSVTHRFDRDMLDPVLLRTALLDLVVTPAERLRPGPGRAVPVGAARRRRQRGEDPAPATVEPRL